MASGDRVPAVERKTGDSPVDAAEAAELRLLLRHIVDRTARGLSQVNASNASERRMQLRTLQLEVHRSLHEIERSLQQS